MAAGLKSSSTLIRRRMKCFLSLLWVFATLNAHATSCSAESFSLEMKFVAAAFDRATDVLLIDVVSASKKGASSGADSWVEQVRYVVRESFKGAHNVGHVGVFNSEIRNPHFGGARSVLNDPAWIESVEPGKPPSPAVLPKTWLIYIDSPDQSPFILCSRSTPLWHPHDLELVRVRRLAASRAEKRSMPDSPWGKRGSPSSAAGGER